MAKKQPSGLMVIQNGKVHPLPSEEQPVTPVKIALQPAVVLKWKQVEPVEIEIDPNALTWDDFRFINNEAKGLTEEEQMERVNEILSRLTGQDVRTLPARVVTGILAQMKELVNIQNKDEGDIPPSPTVQAVRKRWR